MAAKTGALFALATQCILHSMLIGASATQPESPVKLGHAVNAAVDAVYIIGLAHCARRRASVRAWLAAHDLRATLVDATPYTEIDLDDPPLPIVGVPRMAAVTAGQVGCTYSHVRVWRDAFERGHTRVLVLEDDVRLTRRLMSRAARVLSDADAGAVARRRAWHWLYLRVRLTDPGAETGAHEMWHGDVHAAKPGWGTAAYVLSDAGIRFLLTRVTAYSFPLDVQIERLQRGLDTQNARFVALHACSIEDGAFEQECPGEVEELSLSEKAGCFTSATSVGASKRGSDFPAPLE